MEDKIWWYFICGSDKGGTQKAIDLRVETKLGTDLLYRFGLV